MENLIERPQFEGLTTSEVSQRIADGKVNGDQNVKTKSYISILRANIITFFNFLFLCFAIILFAFVEFDASGIGNFGFVILIVINSLVGIVQEVRAKRTIDKLALITAPKATIIRDGKEEDIAIKDIVLDDICILSAGDQVCSDCEIIGGMIETNESLITGEPDAIIKNIGSKAMSGSFVVSGKAYAKVEHVGLDNFATKISTGAKYFKKPHSEIMRSLFFIVKVMSVIIIPLGVTLFCMKFLVQGDNNPDLNNTVITTLGTLIAMIPSGLVALSSAVFCISVIRLAKHNTLAQDLYCIETLARVDVLCLDKTGTITEGSMEVSELVPINQDSDSFSLILKNIMSSLEDDNSTANAVRDYVKELSQTMQADHIVPFSSIRKWSGAYIEGRSYVIGASEFVFKNPDESIVKTTEEMAAKGFRVLVVASSANDFNEQDLPSELILEGYVFITDKIRKEAPDTLRYFREQGVQVKIISGDNPITVSAVAQRAGLEDYENVIDMSTIETEEEVYAAALKYTIFGRVLPDQKLMIVKALKKNKHTVAMTGDGVNDVLALKEADCSIAMASGSDAAKNVSSIILMDSNFASMPKVVSEGRRSINNLERSASLFLVKTIYSFFLCLLFMFTIQELPFEPRHLTLLGGVTIGIPSFILALEPNNKRVEGSFLPKVLSTALPGAFTVVLGFCALIICEKFFLTGLTVPQSQSMYFILTLFIGFMFLFRVCLPLSLTHIIVFISMIALLLVTVLIPVDFIEDLFGINKDFTMPMIEALVALMLIMIPIFISLVLGMHVFQKRHGAKYNEKFVNKMHDKFNM